MLKLQLVMSMKEPKTIFGRSSWHISDLWEKLVAHFRLPPEYEEFGADGNPIPGGLERRKIVKECDDSYRSRKRKKDREADRIGKIETDLVKMKNLVEALS